MKIRALFLLLILSTVSAWGQAGKTLDYGLTVPWTKADSLRVVSWAKFGDVREATFLDSVVRFVDPVDKTKIARFDVENVSSGVTRSVTFQDVSGTMYVSGGTDIPVLDGGTGASTAANARTNLGVVIGTDVQAYDVGELTPIAGLTSAADRLPYFTGSGTAALATYTSAGRALDDDADASAQRTTLGVVIGTNVQAYDADLTTYGDIPPSANVQTMLGSADNASIRSNIGIGGGSIAAWTLKGDSTKISLQDTTLATSGKRIIVGSLHDPAFNCVNATPRGESFDCGGSFEKFRALEQSVPFHKTGGKLFPAEFALIVTAGTNTDSLVILDRTTGAIVTALPFYTRLGSNITDLDFKDGVIHLATSGQYLGIDWLTNTVRRVTTGGWGYWTLGVYDLFVTAAGTNYITNAAPAIVSNTVNSVSAIRDPFGKRDALGRLAQWWMGTYGTASGNSVFNPYTNSIYDEGSAVISTRGALLPGGGAVYYHDNGTQAAVTFKYSIFSIAADGFQENDFYRNDQSGNLDLAWGNATIFSAVAPIGRASIAGTEAPKIIVASDSGLVILHGKANDNTNGGQQLIENDFNTGYMAGTTVLAATLDVTFSAGASAADASPYKNALSASGTHNYVQGIIGLADSLTANGYWQNNHNDTDFDYGTSSFSFSVWVKSHSANNPVTENMLMESYDGTDEVLLRFNTTGSIRFLISHNNSATNDSPQGTADLYDANWHHIVGVVDGITAVYLYTDGELAASVTTRLVTASLDPSNIRIGHALNAGEGTYFAGSIDNPQVFKKALTATEIRYMYQQGLSGKLNTLSACDCLPVRTDSTGYVQAIQSGQFIAGNQDSAYIFDPYGIPIRALGSPGGLIKDAALYGSNADSLAIVLVTATKTGAYGRTQIIQPDPKIIDAASRTFAFVQPAVGERVVVDSAGVAGLFWEFDSAIDAAANADRSNIFGLDGTYPYFDADQANQTIEGESWDTIINGGVTDDAIDLSGNKVTVRNLQVKTTPGGGTGYHGVYVTGTYTYVDHVYSPGADQECIQVDGNYATIRHCELWLGDNVAIRSVGAYTNIHNNMLTDDISFAGGTADYFRVTDNMLLSGNAGAITIGAGCDNGIADGNSIDGNISDSGTGNTIGDNEQY